MARPSIRNNTAARYIPTGAVPFTDPENPATQAIVYLRDGVGVHGVNFGHKTASAWNGRPIGCSWYA